MNIITSVPSFNSGEQYKELSPSVGNYKYRFVTTNDVELSFLQLITIRDEELIFLDGDNNTRMTISGNMIKIHSDYAWDGCTPKRWWKIWWGSPDFEDTRVASLFHDCLIQFQYTKHFPFSRMDIDYIFKDILEENEFILTSLYYLGVRIGSLFSSDEHKNVKSLLIKKNVS